MKKIYAFIVGGTLAFSSLTAQANDAVEGDAFAIQALNACGITYDEDFILQQLANDVAGKPENFVAFGRALLEFEPLATTLNEKTLATLCVFVKRYFSIQDGTATQTPQ